MIDLRELAKKVGIPPGGPASMEQIALKIGYEVRPIRLSELAEAVDEFLKGKGDD